MGLGCLQQAAPEDNSGLHVHEKMIKFPRIFNIELNPCGIVFILSCTRSPELSPSRLAECATPGPLTRKPSLQNEPPCLLPPAPGPAPLALTVMSYLVGSMSRISRAPPHPVPSTTSRGRPVRSGIVLRAAASPPALPARSAAVWKERARPPAAAFASSAPGWCARLTRSRGSRRRNISCGGGVKP